MYCFVVSEGYFVCMDCSSCPDGAGNGFDGTCGTCGIPGVVSATSAAEEQPINSAYTLAPTGDLTAEPTADPTVELTAEPTAEPNAEPTAEPSEPTAEPTEEPTVEQAKIAETFSSMDYGDEPTIEPTEAPPTVSPTKTPTEVAPTALPTKPPTQEVAVLEASQAVMALIGSEWAGHISYGDFGEGTYHLSIESLSLADGTDTVTFVGTGLHTAYADTEPVTLTVALSEHDSDTMVLTIEDLQTVTRGALIVQHPGGLQRVNGGVFDMDAEGNTGLDVKGSFDLERLGGVDDPTAAPTQKPTAASTQKPTAASTQKPTAASTQKPTAASTQKPTAAPTPKSTPKPTPKLTAAPTKEPAAAPTNATPTNAPTNALTELKIETEVEKEVDEEVEAIVEEEVEKEVAAMEIEKGALENQVSEIKEKEEVLEEEEEEEEEEEGEVEAEVEAEMFSEDAMADGMQLQVGAIIREKLNDGLLSNDAIQSVVAETGGFGMSVAAGSESQSPVTRHTIASVEPTSEPTVGPTAEATAEATVGPTADADATVDLPSTLAGFDGIDASLVNIGIEPTEQPTMDPTEKEFTEQPTEQPTQEPTSEPTAEPSEATAEPTADPTANPTIEPTVEPTVEQTEPKIADTFSSMDYGDEPTAEPTEAPTEPTEAPTEEPHTVSPTKPPTESISPKSMVPNSMLVVNDVEPASAEPTEEQKAKAALYIANIQAELKAPDAVGDAGVALQLQADVEDSTAGVRPHGWQHAYRLEHVDDDTTFDIEGSTPPPRLRASAETSSELSVEPQTSPHMQILFRLGGFLGLGLVLLIVLSVYRIRQKKSAFTVNQTPAPFTPPNFSTPPPCTPTDQPVMSGLSFLPATVAQMPKLEVFGNSGDNSGISRWLPRFGFISTNQSPWQESKAANSPTFQPGKRYVEDLQRHGGSKSGSTEAWA
jgi:hypothetical protein